MPPRIAPARNASSPYSRRSAQPKSSRQQFSACGACRMRRVRCDLKDLPSALEPQQCSNCKERGLNCVDEYAEMKAVKLLRRGRRLQQVEAIYGKVKNVDISTISARTSSQIPTLSPDFFSSPFWTWFCIQRPIFDPNEFRQRYIAHTEGTHPLGHEGGIIAMLLVLWAATFGVDEFGSSIKNDCDDNEASGSAAVSSTSRGLRNLSVNAKESLKCERKRDQEETSSMLREILELIDFHGIMRRPTFDSVRILLLILPLLEEVPHLERTAMYETALSQARALCAPVAESPALLSSPPPFSAEENHLRARVYLYAQIQEGISTALKGGHLVFHNNDLDTLQHTLVEHLETSAVQRAANGDRPADGHSPTRDVRLVQLTAIPFRLSLVCRKVHAVLTGPKAARQIEEHNLIDANGMHEIWDGLDQCWRGFSALKNNITEFGAINTEYFVDAWLIFVFECHNVVLESLKHYTFASQSSGSSRHRLFPHSTSRPSSNSSSSSPYLPPHQLYLEARTRCIRLLPHVSRIIRHHLSKNSGNHLNLFTWDAGLVRDGCFFAGLLSVSLYEDLHCLDGHDVKLEESDECITPEEMANLCLAALAEMRWAFSKSDERMETIRLALKNSKERRSNSPRPSRQMSSSAIRTMSSRAEHSQSVMSPERPRHSYIHTVELDVVTNTSNCHSFMHLDTMLAAPRQVESPLNTTCSTDGTRANGWSTYTPPPTASSLSNNGSPYIHGITSPGSFRSNHDDPIFYHIPEALNQFTNTDSLIQTNIPVIAQVLYQSKNAAHDTNATVESPVDCLSPSLLTSAGTCLRSPDIDSYMDSFYS